ncbi:hypothetical protein BT96DRAFT_1005519 [Gymnopus androsaceus JB14]|uniref:Uncharacterized protein n=1 Tax=Gymnopus androsaceus JB14 TaxID=1447944 RepID=A0A6A4GP48_9AGAR|nr:hypothetical protein BT96DRAFT_1005519 [Gymnopus androsaceus JB14]
MSSESEACVSLVGFSAPKKVQSSPLQARHGERAPATRSPDRNSQNLYRFLISDDPRFVIRPWWEIRGSAANFTIHNVSAALDYDERLTIIVPTHLRQIFPHAPLTRFHYPFALDKP